jgi:hypothetical protein
VHVRIFLDFTFLINHLNSILSDIISIQTHNESDKEVRMVINHKEMSFSVYFMQIYGRDENENKRIKK